MAINVDTLEIEIGASSKEAVQELNKLDNTLKSIQNRLNGKWSNPLKNLKTSSGGTNNQDVKVRVDTKEIDRATKKVNAFSKTLSSLKRIAFYRLIRSAIKAVTDSFKEGVENVYQYSKAVGTDFAPSMDKIATSALYLKNALGSLAAPLIQTIAPAVDFVIDKFVDLINIINQVLAALSGKGTYTKAVKNTTEFAKATTGAAKAAKSFALGIDELNTIKADSGGGGGATTDFSKMFEEASVDPLISENLNNILGLAIAIGVALATWKIASAFSEGLSTTAAGLALIVGGITLVTLGFKDMYENGMTLANTLETVTGIIATGLGISLLTGSFIPALIAGLAAALLAIVYFTGNGEKFVEGLRDIFDGFGLFFEGIFTGDMEKATEGLKKVWEGLKTSVGAIVDSLKDAWNGFYDWFNEKTNNKFKPILDGIEKFFRTAADGIGEILDGIGTMIEGFINDDVEKQGEGLTKIVRGVVNTVISIVEGGGNLIVDATNLLIGALNNFKIDVPEGVPVIGGTTFGFSIPKFPRLDIPRYEGGGFPKEGEIFAARENGPELVGRIGNKTAVVNNEQIVSSVEGGVERANEEQNALLREQNRLLSAILEKNSAVVIDGKTITSTVEKVQRERGAQIMAGGVLG